MEETYLFEKEIRVFGIKRSGIHAISGWLHGHFGNNSIIFNDSKLSLKPKIKKIKKRYCVIPSQINYLQKRNLNYPYGALINISEDFDLEKAAKKLSNEKSSYNVLKNYYAKQYNVDKFSRDQFNILIYRSCFNQMASTLNHRSVKHRLDYRYHYISMKTQYELEALEATNILKNRVVVFYDRWFVDIEYRKQISKKLGLVFTDDKLNFMWSLGSSFNLSFNKRIGYLQGRAQKMKVLDRYKILEEIFDRNKDMMTISRTKDKDLVKKVSTLIGVK